MSCCRDRGTERGSSGASCGRKNGSSQKRPCWARWRILGGGGSGPSVLPEVDRLCPSELYTRVLSKSAKVMDPDTPAAPAKPDTPSHGAKTCPQGPTKPQVVPFPEALGRVFATEWGHFKQSTQHGKLVDNLYTLPDPVMTKMKVPTVDAPILAVSSATTLPSEGEWGPKDASDKRVEASLKRAFEAKSQHFRAEVTSSIFSRSADVWAEELAEDKSLSNRARCTLKKIALASVAAADCAYDSLKLSARAMAMGVLARRQIWLRQWDGDSASSSRVLHLPFKGEKLFGEMLEPLLVENKEKQKMLPANKKDTSKRPQSFRQSNPGFKAKGYVYRPKPKWDRSKAQYKKRPGPAPSSAGKPPEDSQTS